MDEAVFLFFAQKPDALALYEVLEQRIFAEIKSVSVQVKKTQISFYRKHLFACVSFARVRKKSQCPDPYIVVTFGLNRKEASPRIDLAVEPYPTRWTHHILISQPEQIDDELMAWMKEAAAFSAAK